MPPSPPAPRPPAAAVGFRLIPFAAAAAASPLRLHGWLHRSRGQLLVHYLLDGNPEALRLPQVAANGERRDGLWRSTCLECFLALPGDPGYWELNVSPAGHWNLYRLSRYRQGLRPEPTGGPPRLRRRRRTGGLAFELELPLPEALAQAPELELAVTAVIETNDGLHGYWALVHAAPEPDFHRRESFLLRL
ncbi:MAG: DOMON-like domain-containing protein [Synechococcus sp.]|nr:DOMON-like domain-containing protein [Synechococcus sp.]